MQILNMIEGKEERDYFVALFSDLSFEIEEMGYEGMEEDLVESLLFDHFGLEMMDENQLAMLTKYILEKQKDPTSLKSILHVVNMQKGAA
jgi:spore coat polysaccharide biosynthesis predicted glycosyltransferase SpsG